MRREIRQIQKENKQTLHLLFWCVLSNIFFHFSFEVMFKPLYALPDISYHYHYTTRDRE